MNDVLRLRASQTAEFAESEMANGERYQFEPAALAGAGHGRPGTARAR
jgi:hypothetical protein